LKSRWYFITGLFVALLVTFACAEVTMYIIRDKVPTISPSADLTRVDLVSADEFATQSTELIGIDDELGKFRDEVYPLVKDKNDDFPKALILKEWVMNQVSQVGPGITGGTPYARLQQMRQGKSALCGDMALVYLAALRSIGIESRYVVLSRSLMDNYDTHSTVEVSVDGKWVVVDPTFNAYFVINGTLASAMDLHQFFLENDNDKHLEIIEGGNVSYPGNLDTYYIDPLTLYNNVFVWKRMDFTQSEWEAIPGLKRYFDRADYSNVFVMSYGQTREEIANWVDKHNFLISAYYCFSLICPIVITLSIVALAIMLFWRHSDLLQRKRNQR
jgi:hypothetical protein